MPPSAILARVTATALTDNPTHQLPRMDPATARSIWVEAHKTLQHLAETWFEHSRLIET